MLYSCTGETYADALNTFIPDASGAVVRVPAYGLLDLNLSLHVSRQGLLRTNMSNATNK